MRIAMACASAAARSLKMIDAAAIDNTAPAMSEIVMARVDARSPVLAKVQPHRADDEDRDDAEETIH